MLLEMPQFQQLVGEILQISSEVQPQPSIQCHRRGFRWALDTTAVTFRKDVHSYGSKYPICIYRYEFKNGVVESYNDQLVQFRPTSSYVGRYPGFHGGSHTCHLINWRTEPQLLKVYQKKLISSPQYWTPPLYGPKCVIPSPTTKSIISGVCLRLEWGKGFIGKIHLQNKLMINAYD
jgi:hypothetical protein